MTRSSARELAVHLVFELGFRRQDAEEFLNEALQRPLFALISRDDPLYAEFPNLRQRAYIETLVRGVDEHGAELDGYIEKYSIGWSFSRLPRMVVAILRVCMYEILYMRDVPNAAAINEAVELTKKYAEPELAGFVNGILGSFVRSEPLPEPTLPPPPPDAFEPEEAGEG